MFATKSLAYVITFATIWSSVDAKVGNDKNLEFLYKWPSAASGSDYCYTKDGLNEWKCSNGKVAQADGNIIAFKMKSVCGDTTGAIMTNKTTSGDVMDFDCLSNVSVDAFDKDMQACIKKQGTTTYPDAKTISNKDMLKDSFDYIGNLLEASSDKSASKRIDEAINVAKTVPPVKGGQAIAAGLAITQQLLELIFPSMYVPQWVSTCKEKGGYRWFSLKKISTSVLNKVDKREDISPQFPMDLYQDEECIDRSGFLASLVESTPNNNCKLVSYNSKAIVDDRKIVSF